MGDLFEDGLSPDGTAHGSSARATANDNGARLIHRRAALGYPEDFDVVLTEDRSRDIVQVSYGSAWS